MTIEKPYGYVDEPIVTIRRSEGHPYFKHLRPKIDQITRNGEAMFRVKWTPFDGIKQDPEFSDIDEALAFYKQLVTGDADCQEEYYEDSDKYWREYDAEWEAERKAHSGESSIRRLFDDAWKR